MSNLCREAVLAIILYVLALTKFSGNQECSGSTFGQNCTITCSKNCNSPCDIKNGSCTECKPGYYGESCLNSCPYGCDSSGCNQKDGSCTCAMGFYGEKCNITCPSSCLTRICNQKDGSCICRAGKIGVHCIKAIQPTSTVATTTHAVYNFSTASSGKQDEEDGDSRLFKLWLPVGLGSLGLFIIIILVVVVAIRSKRRGQLNKPTDQTEEIGLAEIPQNPESNGIDNSNPTVAPTIGPDSRTASVNGDVIETTPNSQDNWTKETEGNTYEKLGIKVAALPVYIQQMRQREKAFEKEYRALPSGLTAPCVIGLRPGTEHKNRFKNIIAYDHSRVLLEGPDPVAQYINASYIHGYDRRRAFIASQGPTPDTEADFIQMIWEQKVPLVVMVTNLEEKGKSKCSQYWPDQVEKEQRKYKDITVTKLKEVTLPHYVIRDLELQKYGNKRRLDHIQYTSWPKQGVPQNPAAFLNFHQRAQTLYKHEKGPTVVHCSAGVGRTGTFLAVEYLLKQAAKEGIVNIFGSVQMMSKDRTNIVQSLDQYFFIHECILEALHCGKMVYETSGYDALTSCVTPDALKQQFSMLEILRPVIIPQLLADATSKVNIKKNRTKDVLASRKLRPALVTHVEGSNEYINAVFVNGYMKEQGFIATQSPLPATVVDLWRLVMDYRCSTIIALNNTGEKRDCPSYWKRYNTRPFTVQEVSQIEDNGHIKRHLKVEYRGRERIVKQFHVRSWRHGSLPPAATLLELYGQVKEWQQESEDGPVIVHCLYGAEETGLFIALCHICDKIDREQEVDVYHVVQQIRNSQPLFISNMAQYEWLHQAAYDYITSFSTNSNFT